MTAEALLILSHFQMRKEKFNKNNEMQSRSDLPFSSSATVVIPFDPQSKNLIILVAL